MTINDSGGNCGVGWVRDLGGGYTGVVELLKEFNFIRKNKLEGRIWSQHPFYVFSETQDRPYFEELIALIKSKPVGGTVYDTEYLPNSNHAYPRIDKSQEEYASDKHCNPVKAILVHFDFAKLNAWYEKNGGKEMDEAHKASITKKPYVYAKVADF
jgi:hypothetical protein